MSHFDAAPPNTHAGGNDDALRTLGTDPYAGNLNAQGEMVIDREAYKRDVPLWKRVWVHSLTQMILLSIQSFCGPAMSDAILGESRPLSSLCTLLTLLGLGGGGLATPQVSNTATAITYAMLATVCMLGGPLVNKLGTKWALVIGACSFPLEGASYYCNSKFGNQWFLVLGEQPNFSPNPVDTIGAFISGVGTGCW